MAKPAKGGGESNIQQIETGYILPLVFFNFSDIEPPPLLSLPSPPPKSTN